MAAPGVELSPAATKHLVNARGFVLVLLLLVLIAGAHVIWASFTISRTASSQARKYKAAALFDDADVSLHDYLFDGAPHSVERLERAREELRELCADNEELGEWSQWQERWYRDFAQPLIKERQKVDAGQSTVSKMQILYLQRNAGRQSWGTRTFTLPSGESFSLIITPKDRVDVGGEKLVRQVALHIVIALVIWFTGLLSAAFGLGHISSLSKQQT
jgi:hypothetical protein